MSCTISGSDGDGGRLVIRMDRSFDVFEGIDDEATNHKMDRQQRVHTNGGGHHRHIDRLRGSPGDNCFDSLGGRSDPESDHHGGRSHRQPLG